MPKVVFNLELEELMTDLSASIEDQEPEDIASYFGVDVELVEKAISNGAVTYQDVYNKVKGLKYFGYKHLPEKLQELSKPFCDLAIEIDEAKETSNNPEEVEMCLRKLLEAKDCLVRASL